MHASTQHVLEQIGLTKRLNALPHAEIYEFPTHFPDGTVSPPPRAPHQSKRPPTLEVSQARFIELLVDEARQYPGFSIAFGARAEALIEHEGNIHGVRYRTGDGWGEVHAKLVVGADGRFSKIRQLAGLKLIGSADRIDLVWLRLPRSTGDPERAHGIYLGSDGFLVAVPRADDWQIGFTLPKDGFKRLRAAGIEALRASIVERAPFLADRTHLIADWRQTALLQVETGRVERWYRPGLLLIGDAAHVMSPAAGVGINYAIQDAVVASNVLGRGLRGGVARTSDLAKVQRRRELPTRLMQAIQRQMRPDSMLGTISRSEIPLFARLMRLPLLNQVPGRLIAFAGFTPERVRALDQCPADDLQRTSSVPTRLGLCSPDAPGALDNTRSVLRSSRVGWWASIGQWACQAGPVVLALGMVGILVRPVFQILFTVFAVLMTGSWVIFGLALWRGGVLRSLGLVTAILGLVMLALVLAGSFVIFVMFGALVPLGLGLLLRRQPQAIAGVLTGASPVVSGAAGH
jgi:2-polyprenyl-6-methoxyphenol hydroxylase-like FAD-dependent oxidoreductase